MTGTRPDEFKLELYLGGAWVDVTADMELSLASLQHKWAGRADQFGAVSPSRISLQLVNNGTAAGAAGKYSPDNPLSAYYGQLKEGIPARWTLGSLTAPGVMQRRYWLGEVQSLNPVFPGDDAARGMVEVALVDVLARTGRVTLRDMLTEQTLTDGVYALWLLSDPAGSTAAAEHSPSDIGPLAIGGDARQIGWGGGTGLAYDGLGTVQLNQSDQFGAGWLETYDLPIGGVIEAWVSYPADLRPGPTDPYPTLFEGTVTGGTCTQFGIVLNEDGKLVVRADNNIGASPSGIVADGRIHHVAVFGNRSAGGLPAGIYVDGVLAGTANARWYGLSSLRIGAPILTPWQTANGGTYTHWRGTVSRVAIAGSSITAESVIPARYAIGVAPVEPAPARVERLLTHMRGLAIAAVDGTGAALSPSSTDYSGATVGAQETQGKSVTAAMLEAWAGEGGRVWATRLQSGGAATPPTAPQLTLAGRNGLRPIAPKLIVNVESDLEGAPGLTRTTDGQVSVVTASSRTLSVTVSDAALITAIGQVPASVGSALAQENQLRAMGQDRIAQGRETRLRLTGIRIDAFTAPAVGGYSLLGALMALVQGDRIRVTGLPQAKFGYTQMDCYLIDATETHSVSSQGFALTVVAADQPAELRVDDATYGRTSSPAAANLRVGSGGITASATTMPLAFTAGPGAGLTLDASQYPLDLDVNGECVTVAAAPGGATSPQSVTVARGQRGTVARAHASGEPVDIWLTPRLAW